MLGTEAIKYFFLHCFGVFLVLLFKAIRAGLGKAEYIQTKSGPYALLWSLAVFITGYSLYNSIDDNSMVANIVGICCGAFSSFVPLLIMVGKKKDYP